jgi:hypothetical protein
VVVGGVAGGGTTAVGAALLETLVEGAVNPCGGGGVTAGADFAMGGGMMLFMVCSLSVFTRFLNSSGDRTLLVDGGAAA